MSRGRRRWILSAALLASAVVLAARFVSPTSPPTADDEAASVVATAVPPAPLSTAPRALRRSGPGVGAAPGTEPSAVAPLSPAPVEATQARREVTVRAHFYDADTGDPVPGRWAPEGSAGTFVPLDMVERGASDEEIERAWGAPTTDAAVVPVWGGRAVRFSILYRGARDYVFWDEHTVDGTMMEGARELVVHVPLRRAMALDVTVLNPTGRPADGATVAAVWVGNQRLAGAPWPVNADGVAHVDPIPFLPDEPVVAGIEWAPERARAEPGLPSEDGPPAEAPVRTRVPANAAAPWAVTVRLKGPASCRFDHNETDNDLAASFVSDRGAPPGTPRGAARVRVLGIDGRPVAGATVTIGDATGSTRADGAVTFERVLAGDRPVTVWAFGHFPMSGSVRVVADTTTDVEVHEPVGATLDVVVVDAAGVGRTAAQLTVRTDGAIPPFDVVDGVQRLDPFTDERGRRTFARVAPGPTTVVATWGSRRGVAQLVVRDGERTTLRVIVP